MARSAYDTKHIKSVRAWVLLREGKPAGKLVGAWGDSGSHALLMTASVWKGPLSVLQEAQHIRKGGGGYDKWEEAVRDFIVACASKAVNRGFSASVFSDSIRTAEGNAIKALRMLGYEVIEAV